MHAHTLFVFVFMLYESSMGWTFPASGGFQDSDFFQSKKNSIEMHFECDFAPFRIQTLSLSRPGGIQHYSLCLIRFYP